MGDSYLKVPENSMRTLTFLVPCVSLSAVLCGCNVFDGSLIPTGPVEGDEGLPPKPDIPDDGTDAGELFFRLTDVQLNNTVDWANIGRNLDRLTTTTDTPDIQCRAPAMGSPLPIDGPGGIDNVLGAQLLGIISIVIPCLEPALAGAHASGAGTLILHITGWNGERNDSRVQIALLTAADGTSEDPADVMWDSTARELVNVSDSMPAPSATGATTDTYYIRSDSFSGGTTPVANVFDNDAYISDGTFVFALPDRERIPLNAGIGSLTLSITHGVMVGTLNDDATAMTDGALSGRFRLQDLLNAGEPIGVCSETQPVVEMTFQEFLDVRSSEGDPNDPESECDAMSLGIPFSGVATTVATDGGGTVLRTPNDPELPNACQFIADNPGMAVCDQLN